MWLKLCLCVCGPASHLFLIFRLRFSFFQKVVFDCGSVFTVTCLKERRGKDRKHLPSATGDRPAGNTHTHTHTGTLYPRRLCTGQVTQRDWYIIQTSTLAVVQGGGVA